MILTFVLAAMLALSPKGHHDELAGVIARVVAEERPLFANDEDRRRTAALVVAIAYRESGFNMHAVSKTDDFCAMQVHHRPDLARLPDECVRTGIAMLRESMRVCPAWPLAHYASGPGGCTNARAQRISRDRMAIAGHLVRTVKP